MIYLRRSITFDNGSAFPSPADNVQARRRTDACPKDGLRVLLSTVPTGLSETNPQPSASVSDPLY
jgi:hypothetical protein